MKQDPPAATRSYDIDHNATALLPIAPGACQAKLPGTELPILNNKMLQLSTYYHLKKSSEDATKDSSSSVGSTSSLLAHNSASNFLNDSSACKNW
jgi:hypothetical protein